MVEDSCLDRVLVVNFAAFGVEVGPVVAAAAGPVLAVQDLDFLDQADWPLYRQTNCWAHDRWTVDQIG